MTQVQIMNQLGTIGDLYTAVANAKSAMKVAERSGGCASGGEDFIKAGGAVKAQLGVRSPLLADFGIGVPSTRAAPAPPHRRPSRPR